MRRRMIVYVAQLLIYSLVSHDASADSNAQGALVDEHVRTLMTEIKQAALDGDTEKTESLMTDRYIQTDITGHCLDKKEWLETYSRPLAKLIKDGIFHWERYEESDVQVRSYGNAAIAMGRLDLKGRGARWGEKGTWVADPEAHPELALRFTRVYVREHGRWKLAAIHNAALQSPPTKAKP